MFATEQEQNVFEQRNDVRKVPAGYLINPTTKEMNLSKIEWLHTNTPDSFRSRIS